MNEKRTLWVVTPLYFDSKSYLLLRQEILKSLGGLFDQEQVVFVLIDDSAGQDNQLQDIVSLPRQLVLPMVKRSGHQKAIVHGLRQIVSRTNDMDIVVTIDGDGEDNPKDILRLIEKLEEEPQSDVCLARRTFREETLTFKILYYFYRILFSLLVGRLVKTGNFAAIKASFLKKMIGHVVFDLCYSSSLLIVPGVVSQVPCARGRRYYGHSKMGLFRLIRHGLQMMLPFWKTIFKRVLLALVTVLVLVWLANS